MATYAFNKLILGSFASFLSSIVQMFGKCSISWPLSVLEKFPLLNPESAVLSSLWPQRCLLQRSIASANTMHQFAPICCYVTINMQQTICNRPDSRLNVKLHGLDSKLNVKLHELDSKLNVKLHGLDSKLNVKLHELDSKLNVKLHGPDSVLNVKLHGLDSELNV